MWFKNKNGVKGGKNVYMLLDRSGSMSTSWAETLGSINGYVEKLEDDVNVYLASFDDVAFDILEESSARDWKQITNAEVTPRGMTPLYDSAAKVMDRMIADNPERAVFVVMTDGHENNSREYTLDAVKARLKTLEEKQWPAVFLGADFSNVTTYVSSTFTVAQSNIVNTNAATRGLAMNMMAGKTATYFNAVNTTVSFATAMAFTDEEKSALSDTTIPTVKTTVSRRTQSKTQ